MGLPDEVQDGQTVLALRPPQATAKLLQKHRRALRRSQEQDRIDLGNVTPSLNRSTAKTTLTCVPAAGAERPRAPRRDDSDDTATDGSPIALNSRAMNSACAMETQNPRARMPADRRSSVVKLLDHQPNSGVVACVEVLKLRRCRSRVETSRHAKGRSRRGCRSTGTGTAGRARALPRAASRRRSAHQTDRGRLVRPRAPALPSGRAASLVGCDRAVADKCSAAAWWNSSTMTTSKASGGIWSRAAWRRDWTDANTCRHSSGRRHRRRARRRSRPEAPGETRAGSASRISSRWATKSSGAAPPLLSRRCSRRRRRSSSQFRSRRRRGSDAGRALPLDLELLEDLDLMRIGSQVEARANWIPSVSRRRTAASNRSHRAPGRRTRSPDPPSSFKFAWNFSRMSPASLRKPNIPLDAVDHCRLRQVRRADVGRREPDVPMKQPGLRVKRVDRVS